MAKTVRAFWLAMIAVLLVPTMATAQFSDGYNFLKAVRDRNFAEANKLASRPGSVLVDTRDVTTGETALHIVVKGRDLPWINFLLQKGARADVRDSLGNTPLMLATQLRFDEGAKLLIAARAKVDLANNSGETPLIRAVQLRYAPLVTLLLRSGANPDKRDTIAGLSARDYAKRDPRAATILKLIEEIRLAPAAGVAGPRL